MTMDVMDKHMDIEPEATEITVEQAQAYLNRRGAGCPACGDSAIEGGSYNLDTGTIYQAMYCTECGADWNDAYELDHIVEIKTNWDGVTYE